MSETNRSYRIKANVNEDTFIDVNLNQNIEVFEMLSLKIASENFYKLHTADYGCVAGRVIANGGVGVPNAKLSIFIAMDEETKADDVLSYLYPYNSSFDRNGDGIRYNLLPEDKLTNCHQNIGTFPSKRLVLDDDHVLEIFDKYYKFTTTTNVSGDYMIFGVPTGSQTLHMDLDISDIGDLLSQKPKDLIYKGYNSTMFENANMFKADKTIDGLPQVFTQTESVYVYPFWGEKSEMGELDSNGVRITRKDINVDYKFEPTCVFIGSLVTDEKSNGFTKRCIPTERMGKMDRITTGEGTIEMIRKTTDGSVESYTILGNQLIDGNGTWCYQIPMNLDYVTTDEYGNIVPTDDPNKGVPTRARVRFRFSLADFESDYQNSHLVKVLVPNNPHGISEDKEIDYVFGTNTDDNEEGTASYRDLFYNNVYTVKSYIPRLQHRNFDREKRFSGIKAVNVNVGNNPIPYNNMRIDITFLFTLQCAIMHALIWIVGAVNSLISFLLSIPPYTYGSGKNAVKVDIGGDLASGITGGRGCCITIGDGACPDLEDWYFAPRCKNTTLSSRKRNPLLETLKYVKKEHNGETQEDGERLIDRTSKEIENRDEDEKYCITNNIEHFIQCVEIAFAQEYEVIQFDFYNDWINGLLYIPRWFARIRKKRTFLFGLIKTKEKLQACVEGNVNYQRKYVQQCSLSYTKDPVSKKYTQVSTTNGCHKSKDNKFKCHKKSGRRYYKIRSGYVRPENTSKDQTVYYFKPCTVSGPASDKRLVKLFATDIVLLGSLSDRNVNGIPQAFKELVSSTYQMPTNLAATNLGHVGYMYSTKEGTYLCGDNVQDGVKMGAQTFGNELAWTKNMGYEEEYEGINTNSTDYDVEYAVTESSGIDWGYTGPGQAYSARTKNGKTEIIEQNRSSLYQPGGHFLGISCTASEANIKSCVNLSRVCEIGVSLSSRQNIPDRNGDDVSYNAVTVPTGVISRDEILDDGFRSEFATMNFNGLETKVDPVTRRRIYKFEIMNPRNFDGTFGKISNGRIEYNDTVGKTEEGGVVKAYKRTAENANIDYYDFRFGWHGGNEIDLRKKYLLSDGNSVSIPIYENSFYFYFGLHDGSTALDRFFKEYFAECLETDEHKAIIRAETEPFEVCDTENDRGSVIIHFVGFEDDVRYAIRQRNPDTGYIQIDGSIYHVAASSTGTFVTEKIPLAGGEYTVDVFPFDSDTVISTKDFAIAEVLPSEFYAVEFDVVDFLEEVDSTQTGPSTNGNGYLEFSNIDSNRIVGIYAVCNGEYADVKGTNNPAGLIKKEGYKQGNRLYAWIGNADYEVFVGIDCRGREIWRSMGSAFVRMPIRLDIQIGPYTLSTYKNIQKAGVNMDSARWWETLLNGASYSKEYKWSAEKAITYDKTYSSTSRGSIDVREIGGNTPYDRVVKGYGERSTDSGDITASTYSFDDKESAFSNGYDLSETSFNIPTMNIGLQKGDYQIRFSDSVNGQMENSVIPSESGFVTFPSIYRPFHMKYIVFRSIMGGNVTCNYSLTVYNGAPYDNTFSKIEANGLTNPQKTRNTVAWSSLSQSSNRDFSTLVNVWTTSRGSSDYFATAEESAPSGYEGEAISINETVTMPSDGSTNITPGMRFFVIYKKNAANAKVTDGQPIPADIFRDLKLVPEGISYPGAQEYKGSCAMRSFGVTRGSNYYYFEPGNELESYKIFSGNMEDVEALNETNSLIVAIYDPWTVLGDDLYAISQNAESKYSYVNKDETSLSVISVYDKNGFMRTQHNPDTYPSQNEYYLIDFEHRMSITSNGVIEVGSDSDLEVYSMGSFTVGSNTDMVSIPNIRVTLIAENVALTSGHVTIFIVDNATKEMIAFDPSSYEMNLQHIIFYKEYHESNGDEETSHHLMAAQSVFSAGQIRDELHTLLNEFHVLAVVDLRQDVSHLESGRFTIIGEGANVDYEAPKIIVSQG